MNRSVNRYVNDNSRNLHKIRQLQLLTDSTFILRIDRNDLQFVAGQHISVGIPSQIYRREYSIYSSEKDEYIEILVKEILDGNVSLELKKCKAGDWLEVDGPYGHFNPGSEILHSGRNVFIATGTGIAPFHSFVTSYPGIDYILLHGVKREEEAYGKNDYDQARYFLCTSDTRAGNKRCRVTTFLMDYKIDPESFFFLCGNSNMIFEVNSILKSRGVRPERIFTEVYF